MITFPLPPQTEVNPHNLLSNRFYSSPSIVKIQLIGPWLDRNKSIEYTERGYLMSNSNCFYKTKGWKVKDGEWKMKVECWRMKSEGGGEGVGDTVI